jgi:hypothetical protein
MKVSMAPMRSLTLVKVPRRMACRVMIPKKIHAMTAKPSIDPALPWAEQIERAEPDLLRALLKTFVEALMGAEADAVCGAPYGVRSRERVNSRNGYTGTGSGTPAPARWSWPFPSCARARSSRTGRWSGVSGPSGR